MEPPRPRILIVDDDFRLLETMEQALAAEGYEVMSAADADEGLWLMGRGPVDLVITEVILPGRDGLDVIAVVKTRPPMRVIATARGLWSKPWAYLTAARHVGADEVLAKPFEMEELLALVARQLPWPAEDERRRA
jgi:two-component system response regulator MprA